MKRNDIPCPCSKGFKINTKLKLYDNIINLFSRKDDKVKGYCGHCGRVVFDLSNEWCKKGLCIYCWELKYSLQNRGLNLRGIKWGKKK